MGFPARFPGICSKCHSEIRKGEEISWNRRKNVKETYHVACPVSTGVTIEVPVYAHAGMSESKDGQPFNGSAPMDKEVDSNLPVPFDGTAAPSVTQIIEAKDPLDYAAPVTFRAIQEYQERAAREALERIMASAMSNGTSYTQENGDGSAEGHENGKDQKPYQPEPETVTDENKKEVIDQSALELLALALKDRIKPGIDEDKVKEIVKDLVKDIQKPTMLEIKTENAPEPIKIDNAHENFTQLLYYISKRHHVYLYGPAGSGKSTAASQVAKALSLQFGYISLNPQTPDSRLLGFVDAGGTYRETPFYKIYKDGGVFCIDEMDNASASLLTTLNSMLENGHGAFPCGIIPRHKDFVLVTTGNTNGKGANPMFPERRPFDVAFSERFTFLHWDYDEKLEKSVTLSINPNAENWLNWVRRVRAHCQKEFPRVLVSPRASFKGAEYLKDSGLTGKEIAEAVIFKGLDKDIVTKILNVNPVNDIKAGKAGK